MYTHCTLHSTAASLKTHVLLQQVTPIYRIMLSLHPTSTAQLRIQQQCGTNEDKRHLCVLTTHCLVQQIKQCVENVFHFHIKQPAGHNSSESHSKQSRVTGSRSHRKWKSQESQELEVKGVVGSRSHRTHRKQEFGSQILNRCFDVH